MVVKRLARKSCAVNPSVCSKAKVCRLKGYYWTGPRGRIVTFFGFAEGFQGLRILVLEVASHFHSLKLRLTAKISTDILF